MFYTDFQSNIKHLRVHNTYFKLGTRTRDEIRHIGTYYIIIRQDCWRPATM